MFLSVLSGNEMVVFLEKENILALFLKLKYSNKY